MVIAIDVIVSDAESNPAAARQQTIQTLADILPHVLRKYRIAPEADTSPLAPHDLLAEGPAPSRFSTFRDLRNAG